MSLLVRINLALVAACVIAAMAFSYFSSRILLDHARRGLIDEAHLMMDSAAATREYTAEELLPLLATLTSSSFPPQSVPFYATTQNFIKLRRFHPEYGYKEAALNPTNPRDRATDWEADLIQEFRNSPQTASLVGERDTPMGRSLYLAQPIRVDSECLGCHSTPRAAPANLIARYGSDHGFGWQANEIMGAQIVSVPLTAALAGAEHTSRRVLIAMSLACMFLLAVVNGTIYFAVMRPLRRMSRVADALSTGQETSEEFPRNRTELGRLGRSFERLRISLEKSLKLLEG